MKIIIFLKKIIKINSDVFDLKKAYLSASSIATKAHLGISNTSQKLYYI